MGNTEEVEVDIMIKLFNSTDTDFTSNGERVIHPLKAVVTKEDNGDYFLSIEDTLESQDVYEHGMIITADTPFGNQAFRIDSPERKNNRITFKAWHIFYDTSRFVIQDCYIVDKNCNDALDHLLLNCDVTPNFTTTSNIPGEHSYRCVRKSLEEAINVVLERWGGHLIRNNFNIEIASTIGNDNGVVISSGKNIEEADKEEDWSKVVTKIMPVGKDGIMLDEVYLESSIQYDIPYTKVIKFEQDLEEEDFLTEEEYLTALKDDLRIQARSYLETNSVPMVNYKVKASIDKITDVGDTIYVKHPKCKIDIITEVIAIKYDVIANKYKEIEFGNFKKKLSNLFTDVKNEINISITDNNLVQDAKLQSELQKATNQIWSALKEGYVIYDEDKILILDKIPKEEASNVIMINNGGIGFSNTGIYGTFSSAWTIDGTFDASQINVINLTADMIKGGILKLGSTLNESGKIELYDEANNLIANVDKEGITVYCTDGTYVKLNPRDGFAGYNRNNEKIYWADGNEFHMKNGVIENTMELAGLIRVIPIENSTNKGIGFVSMV